MCKLCGLDDLGGLERRSKNIGRRGKGLVVIRSYAITGAEVQRLLALLVDLPTRSDVDGHSDDDGNPGYGQR